tara:strand:+ start:2516 stop:2695 length:180 start_codon:yes stop_codon:yes gene_type:complete
MTSLITLLISLLGYGTPADFDNMSENELNQAIAEAQQQEEDGGVWGDWDDASVSEEPQP